MSKVIRIQDDTAELLDKLGGTFDSVDDVIKQLADEAGYDEELNVEGAEHEKEGTERYVMISLSDFRSSGDNQTDVMENVTRYLIDKQDLLEEISIPFIPTGKKALINDEPRHPHGVEMSQYRELPGGYYLDTQYDKPTKEARLRSMANECGAKIVFEW